MVNHGVLTGALFMMVGFFYDRTHTRLIKDYGGMAKPMPVAAAVIASVGIILSAAYLLWMYQRTMFQKANDKWLGLKDLSAREIITLVPLVVMVIWIGLYPHTFLNVLHAPAENIMSQVKPYLAGHGTNLVQLSRSFFGGF